MPGERIPAKKADSSARQRPAGVAVRLTNVSVRLGGRDVIDRASLTLPAGSRTLVVGPNGAGKSELLKLLAGQRWPSPRPGSERRYEDLAGNEMALPDLLPRLQLVSGEQQDRYERYGWNFTVSTVIGTGCRGLVAPLGPLTGHERRVVSNVIEQAGLEGLRRRRFLELSYGERRQVLIGRALAASPSLLLLDEIYNGLDTAHRGRLDRLLDALCKTALTLVVTAHRPADAHPGLTRLVAIRDGRIRYDGARNAAPRRWQRLVATDTVAARRAPPAARRVATTGQPLITLHRVSVYREGRAVIRQLNWQVGAHEHWAISGANGSGKSTLLGLVHGSFHAALGGRVERRRHGRSEPIEEWQQRVRLVAPDQHNGALDYPDLRSVVLSGLPHLRRLNARPSAAEMRAASKAMGLAGITRLATRPPRAASYGERRLALLARGLIGQPEAILLDEPLTGLDAGMRQRMLGVLERVCRTGVQLIVAVHDRADLPPSITHHLSLPARSA